MARWSRCIYTHTTGREASIDIPWYLSSLAFLDGFIPAEIILPRSLHDTPLLQTNDMRPEVRDVGIRISTSLNAKLDQLDLEDDPCEDTLALLPCECAQTAAW